MMASLRRTRALVLLFTLALAVACESDGGGTTGGADAAGDTGFTSETAAPDESGEIWVADRGGATVSIVDVKTDTVTATVPLPGGGEPMYINYSSAKGVVFVGDRANDRVVVFDAITREVLRELDAGAGVFHQWALADGDQLWVNADIDRKTTVFDTSTYQTLATVHMPTDLAEMAGADGGATKPHDVLLSPDGSAAFVSYVGFAGESDYVVRFDTSTFLETHRAPVGKDPHLSATDTNDLLYVPCQGTNEVVVLRRADLSELTRLALPGAHGAGMTHGGDRFYVTNLPAEGAMAIYTIDTKTNELVADTGTDAPMVGKPHNVAVAGGDAKIYVTHSGPTANIVSIFDASASATAPTELRGQVTVGTNPFGLGYVPTTGDEPSAKIQRRVSYDVSGLTTLRDGNHYEGWAIIDGQPVSTGKFNVDASGVATDLAGIAIPDGLFDAGRDLSAAVALVITIEVSGDVDIVPNETHYLAGDLQGLGATLTPGHPDALGSDFGDAAGKYILATPTDGADTNETSGIWWISLQMADPTAGLSLPTLPAGWAYEGWVVMDGTPVTTGTFTSTTAADDAAPFSAMDAPGPPFPGEDFLMDAPDGLSFPTDLSETTAVISIEPVPDDSPAPFLLKPLVATVPANVADHQTFEMTNNAAGFPVVAASLHE